MWPLLILSILSLSTIIDRLWFWTNLLIKEKQTVNRVLEAARRDWSIAMEMARRTLKQPIGRFLYSALGLQNPEPEVFKFAAPEVLVDQITPEVVITPEPEVVRSAAPEVQAEKQEVQTAKPEVQAAKVNTTKIRAQVVVQAEPHEPLTKTRTSPQFRVTDEVEEEETKGLS